ncbi:M81 family metallopeptidase, partial [Caballeronia sp. M23-90]
MSHQARTILFAGFQHETNTFAPSKAAYENFERGEGFPLMSRGADVLGLRDVNIPAGGFIRAAEAAGHTLVPVIWAGASPSAHVTVDAFERITGEIVEAARTRKFDAVYLDLHGAMVAEHVDDGEGELLERVRNVIDVIDKVAGKHVPIVASLDLHANVTERMLRSADALVAYRTYPHVDMADTGARAAALLERERNVIDVIDKVAGKHVPTVASLDLHANVTERMLRSADALVAYRTYPHVDMADTGARAAAL